MEYSDPIRVYSTRAFTGRFMPSLQLAAALKSDFGKFFVIRVEDMYRHVHHDVPASRSYNHSCLFLTSGRATMQIGNSTYSIKGNELLFVPAGQVFSFRTGDVNEGYLCHFHNDLFVNRISKKESLEGFAFLRARGNPVVKPGVQAVAFITAIFNRLLQEYTENGLKDVEMIAAWLMAFLCEANRAYVATDPFHMPAMHIVNRFKELVYLHFKTKHLVKEYADMLHVTPNHLNKIIKRDTGRSAGKWIDEAIILDAKAMLYQTRLSVNEIASATGLHDPSYFTRLFKKYEGITPAAYRKMIETSGT